MMQVFSEWANQSSPGNENVSSLPPKNDVKDLFQSLLSLMVALSGVMGNTVVLWLLSFRLQRNSFSTYILNLAGADFFFLCSLIMFFLMELIGFYHRTFKSVSPFFGIAIWFSYISGLSILSAISTERCLAVLLPLWYHCHRPRHMSAVTCALLWTLSLVLSILEWTSCVVLNSQVDWCQIIDFFLAVWLMALFMTLSVCSLVLLAKMLCGSRRQKLTRLCVTIVLTVLTVLICGLPFGIYWFLLIWIQWLPSSVLVPSSSWSLLLSCVNSCANPIIYFFVGSFRQREQRPTLGLVLQKALEDTPEVEEAGGNLTPETMEMSGGSAV
ncbi:PREDICTED: mas-related G-protein coupled receptor member X2-like [Elephantulus edwardii]|uniref:mas-related G-protein coupled receptor member X2-like n=1 Tax=Elephantulus edwardii TaxID=28737 RepID=UPI0003F0F21B|nr:PREDICTED: mas-related G-protein coupled receptor member X2-like [Elephantulus edwardii]